MQLTQEEVQEKIDLTPEQDKAFRALARAAKKCLDLNIHFYQVLESIGGLNGNNVRMVRCYDDHVLNGVSEDVFDESRNFNQGLNYPSFILCDGFADDDHYVELKED